jgi:transcriptional regulator GlxA family with amidase domain
MPDVAILLSAACQPSAVSTIAEALSVGNLQWSRAGESSAPPFRWKTVSFDGKPVRAMGGMTLVADASFDTLGQPDLIFIPALRCDDRDVLYGNLNRLLSRWGDTLKAHYERGGYLAASCSAAFVLAELGLLDGRRATTSWFLARVFRERYPQVQLARDVLVTKDERIFCSAAFSACLYLGLEIVAEFLGPQAVLPCARVMLVDVNRTEQLQYPNLRTPAQHGDELVLRAQTMLLMSLARAPDLQKLARRLNVTTRTLGRRFKNATGETPITFLQGARVERARRLLESTNVGFDQIAYRVGYEDPGAFRRVFVQTVGLSPREYRQRFRLRENIRQSAKVTI